MKALIDTGAKGYLYLHSSIAHKLSAQSGMPVAALAEPILLQGYQGGTPQRLTSFCSPSLTIGSLCDSAAPTILTELGKHDMLIGHDFLARHRAVLNVALSTVSFPVPVLPAVPVAAPPLCPPSSERHIRWNVAILTRSRSFWKDEPPTAVRGSHYQRLSPSSLRPSLSRSALRSPPPADIAPVSAERFCCIARNPDTCGVFSLTVHAVDESIPPAPELPNEYAPFADVFSKADSDRLPPRRSYNHRISFLPDVDRNFGHAPLRRLSPAQLEEVKKVIDENLAKGFIVPSAAPVSSPILFALKPGGGLRFCIDYRKLNGLTKKDAYPLPLIDETLGQLGSARFFTKIDIRQAFHCIRMAADSED